MNITITPNTTPIGGDVLNPVPKSFASGGGGGGGGGPVNFFAGSGVNFRTFNAGTIATIPAQGSATLFTGEDFEFAGGRGVLLLLNAPSFVVEGDPYAGQNRQMLGNAQLTLNINGLPAQNIDVGWPNVYNFFWQNGLYPSPVGIKSVSLLIQNNFYFLKTDPPQETTYATLRVPSLSLTIMEM